MMQMMEVQHNFPQLVFVKKMLMVGCGRKAKRGNSSQITSLDIMRNLDLYFYKNNVGHDGVHFL